GSGPSLTPAGRTCDSPAPALTALLAPGASYPDKPVLPEWVPACALLLVRSYPTGGSSTRASQHGAIRRTNGFLIRGLCPVRNRVRSARTNWYRHSPPRDRTTPCTTHARQEDVTRRDDRARAGRNCPDRPVFVWRVSFGPWEGEGSRASISEPEIALLLTDGKQGAGAAQRRPGCSASG